MTADNLPKWPASCWAPCVLALALAARLQTFPAVVEITHRPPIRVDNPKAGDVDGPKLDHIAGPVVVHDLRRQKNVVEGLVRLRRL